jgi:hypothetical protein
MAGQDRTKVINLNLSTKKDSELTLCHSDPQSQAILSPGKISRKPLSSIMVGKTPN